MNLNPLNPLETVDQKPACLVVLKFQMHWNHHLIRKLSIAYRVTTVFAQDLFLKAGSRGLLAHLQHMVRESPPQFVLLDLDYFYLFDLELIEGIGPSTKKVLISFDDLVLHQINSINASACDLVLTADPLSVLKYRELGMNAEYFSLEASKEIYFDRKIQKDIDVLHFGSLKADRRDFIDYLIAKGIKLHLIGREHGHVPPQELAEYIARSKIVVNFSKSNYSEQVNLGIRHAHRFYLQFKGRVIESGLCRTACVSEYSPSLRLLFSEQEVPDFRTGEECHRILALLLESEKDRSQLADRLYERVVRDFEDSAQIRAIVAAIEGAKRNRANLVIAPPWYWRMALRSKARVLIRSPVLLIGEMLYAWGAIRGWGARERARFFVEMSLWIPWHYCVRIAAKCMRPVFGRQDHP